MSAHACSALDDYLAGDLAGDERAGFMAHLSECPACRRAVREEERIKALLTDATTELERVPAGLTGRVRQGLRVARRRRATAVTTALVASVAAVWLVSRPTPRAVNPSPIVARGEADPPASHPAERARVTFPAGAGVAAVPVPTESPKVTFLWLFLERRPAPPPARPADEQTMLPERSSR